MHLTNLRKRTPFGEKSTLRRNSVFLLATFTVEHSIAKVLITAN